MRRELLAVIVVLVLGVPASFVLAAQVGAARQCSPAGPLVRIPGLHEASGIAVSRRVPGRLWAHNDSGQPVLFALDVRGSVTGRVQLSGATVDDWEAVAVGSCPAGSCLYVADIGDNGASRARITVYRLPEPAAGEKSATVVDVFHATYPDGAHDAEALLVTPDGGMFIVTKGVDGPVALYRFPRNVQPGATVQLERVSATGTPNPDAASRVTDGAVSPDGQWTVLRTQSHLAFYRTGELLAGNWREARRVDLTPLDEPQGEGVALGADNDVYLAGEGGAISGAGTFARFACMLGP